MLTNRRVPSTGMTWKKTRWSSLLVGFIDIDTRLENDFRNATWRAPQAPFTRLQRETRKRTGHNSPRITSHVLKGSSAHFNFLLHVHPIPKGSTSWRVWILFPLFHGFNESSLLLAAGTLSKLLKLLIHRGNSPWMHMAHLSTQKKILGLHIWAVPRHDRSPKKLMSAIFSVIFFFKKLNLRQTFW